MTKIRSVVLVTVTMTSSELNVKAANCGGSGCGETGDEISDAVNRFSRIGCEIKDLDSCCILIGSSIPNTCPIL